MTIILRLFAWSLAAAVAFATLGPAERRPHLNLGQNGEHALAFVLLGLAFGLAYTRNRLHTAAFVIAFTGLIEILQFLAPGRHARMQDFVVDALAASLGLAIAGALDWTIRRTQFAAIGARTKSPRGTTTREDLTSE
ncbi:VanZ family protein [Bradyrhizobium sp. SRL28]|uniref:VanZ family protein n=1 Tax=Bradyrhizobium sp. SRL28 TaxID=2836178 RepID=UPI001BDEBF18|nr:VanZ family protein [Bradyrhizobium sp. SRL28]MBT1509838.1 VanZ family protein [Bradyrhizobium sp. SRL28]